MKPVTRPELDEIMRKALEGDPEAVRDVVERLRVVADCLSKFGEDAA